MKIKIPVIIISLACVVCSYAQQCLPNKNFWADFKGSIYNREIQLSIYRSADNKLNGNCRFVDDELNVFTVSGYEKDCTYYLDATNKKNETTGKFTFQYTSVNHADIYKGSFTKADSKQAALQLQLNTMVGGSFTQRYAELFGTTNEVDSFAAEIKTSFLNNNKSWLAAHCNYPLSVYNGSKKPLMIHNAKEFTDNYNRLFSEAYKERFKKMHCHNMFSNHVGAGMGMGEVVINHTAASTPEKYDYCITAINIIH